MNQGRAMTMAMAVGASLLGAAVVFVLGQPFTVKAQEQKRFQYRVVEVLHETDAMQRMLNDFGGSGWELVAISAGDLTSPRMIFKK